MAAPEALGFGCVTPLYEFDVAVFRALYEVPVPHLIAAGVTHLATKGVLSVVAALGLIVLGPLGNRRAGIALLGALAAHVVLVEGALKHLVGRTRPFSALGLELRDGFLNPESYSFPSGHSVASFATAWLLGARFPRLRWPMLGVALLVALSRVHLGAHYPSDVACGALFGLLLAEIARRIGKVGPDAPPAATEPAPG